MNNQKDLDRAITTALNITFPAVLRTRSWDAYKQLHGYPSYEQWYNAELIMHFRTELYGAEFDGECVCVRGEAPIESKKLQADWAILKWEPSFASGRCFEPRDVLAVGETKIIGLAAAGSGNSTESGKMASLARKLNDPVLANCPCFAYVVLPCLRKRGHGLDFSARSSLDQWFFPSVHEEFEIDATMQHVQIITGWFGFDEPSHESNADDTRFALLQLLLRKPPGEGWEAVDPPMQHRLSSYLASSEAQTPVQAC